MVGNKTDFFEIVDNFEKISEIGSTCIFGGSHDYEPIITIAIPTFKRVKYLKKAIDSAINQQTDVKYEIIIVDNDPTRDCETERLMMHYRLSGVSYYKNEKNLGMAGNWNRVITLAQSGFIAMLHDDDLLLTNFLEITMSIISKYKDIDLLKPAFYPFTTEVDNVDDIKPLPSLSGKIFKINPFSFYVGCFIGAPVGAVFRKSAVIKSGGFNQDFYPSFDYCFYTAFAYNYNLYYLDSYLALYRYADNESLKNETLNNFIKTDYYLVYQLLRRFRVPKIVIEHFLRHKIIHTIIDYKNKVNPHFKFDSTQLKLVRSNPLFGKMSFLFLKLVALFEKDELR